jgi:hypothetical protein
MNKSLLLLSVATLVFAGCGGPEKTEASAPLAAAPASTAPEPRPAAALAGRAEVIRVKGKKGDKFTIAMSMTIAADLSGMPVPSGENAAQVKQMMQGEQSMTVESKIDSEVLSATDGEITIKETVTEATASGKGIFAAGAQVAANQMKGQVTTRTLDERGKVLKFETTSPSGNKDQNPLNPVFPVEAVTAGHTWEATSKVGDKSYNGKFKVERFERIGNADCAVLKIEYSEADLLTTSPITVWIDLSNGMPVKGEGSFKITDGSTGMKMDMKMSLKKL